MEHTVKAYGEELNNLTAEVVRLGGLAEAQVTDSVVAFARRDLNLAQSVIEAGRRSSDLLTEADIERKAIRLIALRQPVAQDLRHTVAAMKISMQLERCGDLAKNIAKRCLILAEAEPLTPLTRSIERMGNLVAGRLKDVLDAYTSSNLDRAVAVWALRRRGRRALRQPVPRTADLHDVRPRARSTAAPTCTCSSPRISNGSAITP